MRSLLVLALLGGAAHANPRPLPMTYTTDLLAPRAAELELYVDMTPLRAISPPTAAAESYLASAFQAELEIGLTPRLELGLYLTFAPDYGEAYANQTRPAGTGTGMKQRLRAALADPGEWPVDVGLYGELVENEREIELEAKLLLHRRFGALRVAANLSAEYELYFTKQREWVVNPSAGASYELTPAVHLGVEAWMRGEYPTHPRPASRTFGLGPHAYVGPTLLMSFGKVWWTLGLYGRVTEPSHDLQPGEPYGRVWARSLIGYDL
jgi:hypothetical protein